MEDGGLPLDSNELADELPLGLGGMRTVHLLINKRDPTIADSMKQRLENLVLLKLGRKLGRIFCAGREVKLCLLSAFGAV